VRLAARALAFGALLLLAACAPRPKVPSVPPKAPTEQPPQPVPTPPVPPPPANAVAAGVSLAGPRQITEADAAEALRAFLASCPALTKRQDKSGLATGADWQVLCAEAATVPAGSAATFFRDRFEWVRVADGKAFATGYYEPEIAGSRTHIPGFDVPIYRTPPDLVRCTKPDGTSGRGRIDETGTCVLYYTRAEIEDGVLAGKGLELAWAADPIDLFFVEIQGSGRLKAPDGTIMRIGYDNQNGRDYIAIGRLLRDRGILPSGSITREAIIAWMRAQPDGGKTLMRENLSYIFFRELTGPGPLGALNVAVTPRVTVAADPLFVPLGAPVFVDLDRNEADGLWVAQDTGGAIKGANRFDTFWGAGAEAERTAGGMSANGTALILLPKGSVARIEAARAAAYH
jgi:membrane-bound lytic murein transglycosylase A